MRLRAYMFAVLLLCAAVALLVYAGDSGYVPESLVIAALLSIIAACIVGAAWLLIKIDQELAERLAELWGR